MMPPRYACVDLICVKLYFVTFIPPRSPVSREQVQMQKRIESLQQQNKASSKQ